MLLSIHVFLLLSPFLVYNAPMTEIEDGYYFWKRVDAVRSKSLNLKQLVELAGLNYHLVKVQRSCNRIPKSMEAWKLAFALKVPVVWLLTGQICGVEINLTTHPLQVRQQLCRIINLLLDCEQHDLDYVESLLSDQAISSQLA